ncbi:23S rRNA (guanosine(2251)-2'-O)-methyltransferase RlmB [Marinivivus vitaminiproducens]|uniref:23S rRNA (guanosine(2251)-2'-O)-methyltransferase RlmB n=1 Tax=Marinivivus vitaminiproducens TaxID=3035935 RepID=UPI00279AC070|nr:23S rRNA (guanosine(2251)-2'-O)-methyltransferase RlmB [Geminicoccaceae bacterium SCSIO 64248]
MAKPPGPPPGSSGRSRGGKPAGGGRSDGRSTPGGRSGRPGGRAFASRGKARDSERSGRPGAGHGSPGAPRSGRPPVVTVAGGGPQAELWFYGQHAVGAALANPRRTCHRLLGTAEALAELGARVNRPGLVVEAVERPAIDARLGRDVAHQGLALQVAPLPPLSLQKACEPAEVAAPVLALDGITDPHNLGAILRSAAAFGARAVVVPARQSAAINGAAAKAASGALEIVPVVEVPNLSRALLLLKAMGYWALGLDGHATETIGAAPTDVPMVLVLGSEGKGLRRLVAETCDRTARLPIGDAVESLNVSVAAGVALYALVGARPSA